jgi:hypothetical protein
MKRTNNKLPPKQFWERFHSNDRVIPKHKSNEDPSLNIMKKIEHFFSLFKHPIINQKGSILASVPKFSL